MFEAPEAVLGGSEHTCSLLQRTWDQLQRLVKVRLQASDEAPRIKYFFSKIVVGRLHGISMSSWAQAQLTGAIVEEIRSRGALVHMR